MNTILSTGSASLAPAEATLLSAFRAMDDDARADVVTFAKATAAHFPRQRPRLCLVHSAPTTYSENAEK